MAARDGDVGEDEVAGRLVTDDRLADDRVRGRVLVSGDQVRGGHRARSRIRTGDPLLTMEVLWPAELSGRGPQGSRWPRLGRGENPWERGESGTIEPSS